MCSEISMPSQPTLNAQDISDVTTNPENKEKSPCSDMVAKG
jgi:hypothetical protein